MVVSISICVYCGVNFVIIIGVFLATSYFSFLTDLWSQFPRPGCIVHWFFKRPNAACFSPFYPAVYEGFTNPKHFWVDASLINFTIFRWNPFGYVCYLSCLSVCWNLKLSPKMFASQKWTGLCNVWRILLSPRGRLEPPSFGVTKTNSASPPNQKKTAPAPNTTSRTPLSRSRRTNLIPSGFW